MTKRVVIVFTHGNVENLIRELSDLIVSRGGRILYRRPSIQPIFVHFGGEAEHGERV